jgi:hypothetical protein
MASERTKPPGLASQGGSELHCLAADAVRVDTATLAKFQARRAVGEAIACGARFIPTSRDFLWETDPGANRSRIRAIIADAKASSADYWRAFVAAIVEAAGGPAR